MFLLPSGYLDKDLTVNGSESGRRGLWLGAEKTQSQENATRREAAIPSVRCTLGLAGFARLF
jgi:hypothetical protein